MEVILEFLKRKEVIIIIILFILFLIFGGFFLFSYVNKEECICNDLSINKEKANEENDDKLINLEVKGEVKNPGVYSLKEDSIIKDVIELCGGFTSNANTNNINLSMKVKDEMVIFIYKKSVYKKVNKVDTGCKSNGYDISKCVEKKESIIESSNKNITSNETKLININTASINELTTLSGIGKSKAEAIITYRQNNGLFKSIEDIMKVSGIGKSTYEKFKANITI